MFKTCFNVIAVVIVFLMSCSNREEGMGDRNNPCDPAGTAWTVNAEPEISGSVDSGWVDFDFSDTTGAVQLHVTATDRNRPYDTLTVTVVITTDLGPARRFSTTDSMVKIDHLKRGTSYSCSLLVTDRKGSTGVSVVRLMAPSIIPLPRPQPIIISSSYNVQISWSAVPGAEEYRVYTAAARVGPFAVTRRIAQPASGNVVVLDTPAGYSPRYYLIAAANSSSESFGRDTLTGRCFYEGISTPSINSVSQGTYTNYIQVSIYRYYYDSDSYQYEIYRSIGDTLSFELIGKAISTYSGSSSLTYNDSVATSLNCYYRITAVDNAGRASRWSAIVYGYIRRLYAPSSVSVVANAGYIGLSWYSVTGAAYYKIYRSTNTCSDAMPVLDSVSVCQYNDTVPTSELYAYSVCAVDTAGHEGTRSACRQSRIILLPAPSNVSASSGIYLRHISLSWSSVAGAAGYIIYRAKTNTPMLPIDTVVAVGYKDTVSDGVDYFYTVAAFNTRGVGTPSSIVSGVVAQPPWLSASVSSSVARLSWSAISAVVYYIYRSSPDSTNFVCIDSTSSTTCSDTLRDYRRYFYRLSMRTTEGVTLPGNIIVVSRPLVAPTGFSLVDHENGVRLSWNRLPGAERYQLYRSTSSSSGVAYLQVDDTTCFDTLVSSQRYWYSVAGIVGSQFTPATAALSGGIIGAPLAPINISVTGTAAGITISWQMSANSSTAAGYRVYRATASTGPFVMLDSTTARTYADPVADTTYYYYQVVAYNKKGSGPASSVYAGRRLRPSSPGMVQASQGKYARKIVVSWSPVASVAGYRCYRAASSSGTYSLFATTTDTMVTDSTCTPNVLYYYRSASYTDVLPGAMGSTGVGMRLGPPSSVNATMFTTGIQVSWSTATYPAAKYYIYRSNSTVGSFSKIDSSTSTTYIDTRPLPGGNCYKVSACGADEATLPSASSLPVGQPVLEPPSKIIASQGTEPDCIAVNWSPSSSLTTGYLLYRSPFSAFNSGVILRATLSTNQFLDTIHSDSMYFYRVRAFGNGGESAYSDSIAGGFRNPVSVPHTPLNIGCTSVTGGIYIAWEPPPSSVGYNAYRLYRSRSQNGSDSLIALIVEPHFIDMLPNSNPTVYWYRVSAYNLRGESILSEAVSGYRN